MRLSVTDARIWTALTLSEKRYKVSWCREVLLSMTGHSLCFHFQNSVQQSHTKKKRSKPTLRTCIKMSPTDGTAYCRSFGPRFLEQDSRNREP